jgi:hypothetical protein
MQDLRNIFEGLIAANHAAVAPGSAVKSCDIQPGSPASAVLQLRCSAEASNCLAFDGLVWNTAVLKVRSIMDAAMLHGSSLTASTHLPRVQGSSSAMRCLLGSARFSLRCV